MSRYGGFDHNAQSLRIVTMLEQQYAEFDGLNLCWETLEGLVKHNGPVTGDIPQTFIDFNEKWDLELGSHASIEAQCAAVADDIAYNAHDLDDGLRAGLFKLDDLSDVPLAGEALSEVFRKYPELEEHRIRHEIVRRQITAMVEDVITNAKSNLADLQPKSVSDVRNFGKTVVCFSDDMHAKEKGIKAFLFDKMYRSPNVMIMRDGAERIIRNLFDVYLNETGDMPNGLQRLSLKNKSNDRPRIIADFIAGMTDSYAISEHERMFDETPDLG
jgi:dGTPase